ncbi:MAG: cardiolipin synthase, partial [Mycobacterium sp.]|nr:cardiolipin synthase [Mycobacterium sp.]
LVATFNLCLKYFTLTRDYGVITDNPRHVAQIIEVFNADWEHQDWAPSSYEGLLWSNSNSRYHMAQFIDLAEYRLDIQHPKYVDAVILDRIAAAAERGVKVYVLCGGKHGISEWDILDTFSSLRTLRRFGVKVHKQKNLRVHAKLVIVDEAHALVGSMNIDRSAFDLRRELGILIDDPAVVARLKGIFDYDWDLSHHYDAPDPLDPSKHPEEDFPHDKDLMHE